LELHFKSLQKQGTSLAAMNANRTREPTAKWKTNKL